MGHPVGGYVWYLGIWCVLYVAPMVDALCCFITPVTVQSKIWGYVSVHIGTDIYGVISQPGAVMIALLGTMLVVMYGICGIWCVLYVAPFGDSLCCFLIPVTVPSKIWVYVSVHMGTDI